MGIYKNKKIRFQITEVKYLIRNSEDSEIGHLRHDGSKTMELKANYRIQKSKDFF